MVIKLNNISSKIFLLNHEDVAVFNSGIHFPRSQFVKIDIPNDVSFVWVPFTMEFQKDNTRAGFFSPSGKKLRPKKLRILKKLRVIPAKKLRLSEALCIVPGPKN